MKKKLIILAVAVLLLGGGAAAYFVTKDDDTNSNSTEQTHSDEAANHEHGDAPVFNPLATDNASFVATMSGTAAGQSYTATIEADGQGNSKMRGDQGGTSFETYLVDGMYYTCTGGQCFKFDAPQTSPVDDEQYSYTADDFAAWQAGSTYKGKASCPAGTCDHWQVNVEGVTSEIFVAEDRRISKVAGSAEGTTYEISYDYRDVSITAPANAQSFPSL